LIEGQGEAFGEQLGGVQDSVADLADDLGTTKDELLEQLGYTEEELRALIGEQGTELGAQIEQQGVNFGNMFSQFQTAAQKQAAALAEQTAAQRVADQRAAAERDRQANIQATTNRAQISTQDIMQQLESMQRAGMAPQPVQLVESSAGFDLSSPLNTGFFSGFQSKKPQQNQQPTTKIASGGYIDDLLAGDLSVDELLDLLR
jgi:sRNA-binding protein